MKKVFTSILIGLTILSSCADTFEGGQEAESTTQVEESAKETTENKSSANEAVIDEELSPASDEELEQSESVSEFSSYEELSQQDFFEPENFEAHLVTDNPGNRIFIFRDGNQQAYKTVFIKDTHRLKVIDIANDELLMNERIH